MTPHEFIAKWKPVDLFERSACHEHFLDLCDLLGQPKPAASDPEGAWYTFEKGVHKTEGGFGWADVWMRNHFGWEYKKKRRDLKAAYNQLLQYRESLENPPLLVVCDLDRFEVHTNFTGTVAKVYTFNLDGLAEPSNLDVLRKLFAAPDALKPGQTTEGLTKQAAVLIGEVADGMRMRGIPAQDAAHFLMKLIFCMFAEWIDLLPNKVFGRSLAAAKKAPERLAQVLRDLFGAMAHGGFFGADEILYFNGGLFADSDIIDLQPDEINKLNVVCQFDWSGVEPSIFGTLFERTLDPSKRSQIGAHYTSREDIVTLLEPVMMAPLRREWADVRARCEALYEKLRAKPRKERRTVAPAVGKEQKGLERTIQEFSERLGHVTVLDPACGSGNFLYVAVNLLLDLEKEVIAYAGTRGVVQFPRVRPTQLAGIEINEYAQQLAQIVIWIGYLQWMHHNGFNPPRNPVLEPIGSVQRMDAIIDLTDPEHPTDPEWPAVEFIVGNPPFLGSRRLRINLGDDYVNALFRLYKGRIAKSADLCCYWFEKARRQIEQNQCSRAGLLATQSIRGGASRRVLDRIRNSGDIFWAISDREWVLDGAMVHVSMVGFDDGSESVRTVDGRRELEILSSLSSEPAATTAKRLRANKGLSFQGVIPMGPLDIAEELALDFLRSEINPHGRPNSDVIRPWANGNDLIDGRHDRWVIDFPETFSESEAAAYESPFEYTREHVLPERQKGETEVALATYWLHWCPRPKMRSAIASRCNTSFIVTPRASKYRLFIRVPLVWLPSDATVAFAEEKFWFFGILHSRVHETWTRSPGMGTQVRERESGFRYTPTTCFQTFPFPQPTKMQEQAIAAAASKLDTLRNNWLNPPEWTREEALAFPGSVDGPWASYVQDGDDRGIGVVRYPRVVPRDGECAEKIKERTLTNLYNQNPTWLKLAHRDLDEAVFAAYGWEPDISDQQLLKDLLSLNGQQSADQELAGSIADD
jgi:hypothetical protein